MKKVKNLIIMAVLGCVLFTGPMVHADEKQNLDEVIVYPNPYEPVRKAHTQITFDNLTGDVVVKIYKITGTLVAKIEANPTTNGTVTWDVKNDFQKPVSSGTYIYLVTNRAGQKAVGKIAIIK